jgi:protein-disulfide isomerase
MKRMAYLTMAAVLVAAPLALAKGADDKAKDKDKDKAAKASEAKAAAPAAAAGGERVVATVDGQPVTLAQVEEVAGSRLSQLRNQEYQLRRQALDEVIARRLAEKEAAARGISADELMRTEVEAKVPAITEAEQKAFYEQNKGRFGAMPEAEALKQIETYFRQQRVRERQQQYVGELKARSGVRIMLEAPRVAVDASDDPSKGPATAPVTIVEFSDFQCPFCARVNPTLQKVKETYGDTVRVVFRDFPLLQIHPQAAKAAEAATCANEQGKFWEMHDRLFANQQKLQVADLKQYAVELGLNAESFNQCLDSGKHEAEWKKDLEDGAKYGLSGTPAFFINGRLISGAQPLEAFTEIIDEELQNKGITPPAKAASSAAAPAK